LVSKGWLGWIFTHYGRKQSINDEVALPKIVSRAAFSKSTLPSAQQDHQPIASRSAWRTT